MGCVCVCTQVPPVRARSAHLIRDGPAPWQPLSACHVYRHRRSAAARGHVYRHSFLGPHHSIRDAAAQPHQRRAATHAAPVAYWSYGSRTWYISPICRAATQADPRRRHQQERAGLGLGIPATLRHTCPDATLAIRHLHPPPPPHPPRGIYLTCVCAAGAAHRRKLIRGLNTKYGSACVCAGGSAQHMGVPPRPRISTVQVTRGYKRNGGGTCIGRTDTRCSRMRHGLTAMAVATA